MGPARFYCANKKRRLIRKDAKARSLAGGTAQSKAMFANVPDTKVHVTSLAPTSRSHKTVGIAHHGLKLGVDGRPIKGKYPAPCTPVLNKNATAEDSHPFADPVFVAEAMTSPERDQWEAAMVEEYADLLGNQTWITVSLPKRTEGNQEQMDFRDEACQ